MARKPPGNKHLSNTLRNGAGPAASTPLPPWCQARGADLLLRLRVQPRASHEGFDGLHGDRLRLRVSSPPVDDAANARVVTLLSELLSLPRASFQIVRGGHAREKDVLVRDAGARAAEIALKSGITGKDVA